MPKSNKKNVNIMATTRRLLSHVGKHRKTIWGILLCAIAGNALALLSPLLVGRSIDHIRASNDVDFPALLDNILLLGLLYVGSALLLWLCAALAVRLSNRTALSLRKDTFARLTHLPLSFFDTNPHGDIVNRFTNDADAVSDGLSQFFTQFFSGIVTILFALGFMLYLSPLVTLAVIIATPLIFVVGKTVTRLSSRQFREQQRILGELSGHTEEQLRGQRVVVAFGSAPHAQREFERIDQELYVVGQKAQFYSSLTNPTTRFVNYIGYILVGLVGALSAIYFGFSIGGIASFLTYTSLFSRPFNEFTAMTTQLMTALAAAERMFSLIDQEPESEDAQAKEHRGNIQGHILFDHVAFSYQPDRPLIQDFSLSVPPGSSVAIVGPTGAGKTTMVNLLMRFYDVKGGRILLDGTPIDELPRDRLRRSFGMVLQETWLFRGTIRDNIAYGHPGATDEEIQAAARAAGAHSFIKRLPEGYQSIIDEGGENISQGQKQLLTIARAMLLKPPMLILDEATSSVDVLTEQKIQQTFLQMMQGHTSFVIAHRLSTIRRADLILVMNQGRVIEQGSHDELLAKGGFYSTLYNSQFDQ